MMWKKNEWKKYCSTGVNKINAEDSGQFNVMDVRF